MNINLLDQRSVLSKKDRRDWLKDVPDDNYISDINLPGIHDIFQFN
jgi:hypothetical protein